MRSGQARFLAEFRPFFSAAEVFPNAENQFFRGIFLAEIFCGILKILTLKFFSLNNSDLYNPNFEYDIL